MSDTILCEIPSRMGNSINVSLIVPKASPNNNKIPIQIFITTNKNIVRLTKFGAYIYGIYNKRTSQVHTTVLTNGPDDLVEFCLRLGKVVSKRYQCPVYVSTSGVVGIHESLEYITEIIKLVDKQYEK